VIASFVLADTEHLHRKIVEMGQRIRQLEDALSIFQSGVSNEVHPLLVEDLLAIKFGPEAPKPSNDAMNENSNVPINTFGTLTIGDGGESNYFGRSAGSEVRHSSAPSREHSITVANRLFSWCVDSKGARSS